MGWVTDRFHCTLKGTFKSLKTAVTIDVNEAKHLVARSTTSATEIRMRPWRHGDSIYSQGHSRQSLNIF